MSQEVKEKEGKRKSEENGNGAGGRAMSRGVNKGEEENRKRVIMLQSSVSCVPRAGSPDWLVRGQEYVYIEACLSGKRRL